MMKSLLALRFRAMLHAMSAQGRRKKKAGTGTKVLLAVLFLYLGVLICGAMGLMFSQLAPVYHELKLDWLYFAMAGLVGLGFAVLGSVFSTQNQLYDARDNDLLLSMPIKPGAILLSRVIPLLLLNLLFAGLVVVPAMVVYAALVTLHPLWLVFQVVSLIFVCLLAQTIACLLGWLLHLLLARMNKSVASLLYMVLFLVVYFAVYSQAGAILSAMAESGNAIAGALQTWVWPLYAMGRGCTGNILLLLAFAAICAALFAIVYRLLSATFLRSAITRRSGRRRKLDIRGVKAGSTGSALTHKELRRFLGSPVYLTNMGLGIILTVALPMLGIVFRGVLTEVVTALDVKPYLALVLCAVLSFTVSTVCISAPSVSLEGKSLWILKSLPVPTRQILLSKLGFHCRLAIPVTMAAGLILAVTFGCSLPDILLTALVPGLLALFCALLGMVSGLRWARLDWINEAYPCKQSVAVLVSMFGTMAIPLLFALLYLTVFCSLLSPTVFLVVCAGLLAAACFGLYRLLVTWGIRKWDAL